MQERSVSGPLLSVVVPCFKEADNVKELVRRIERVLQGICWEVIFVDDDSPDRAARSVFSLCGGNAFLFCPLSRCDGC